MTDEHDEWTKAWDARMKPMEEAFGPADDMVLHAPVPFHFGVEMGGAADVVRFKQHVEGTVYVTSELIGNEAQVRSRLGNYELAMCHRDEEDWGSWLISQLAHSTLESELNPGETMDIGPAAPEGSTIEALLFHEFATFDVGGQPAGVLLCLGITADELALCRSGRRGELEHALREAGVHPFTDLSRESVV